MGEAPYGTLQVPARIVEYVDALPKTVNGKIRRVAIRQKDGASLKSPKLPEGLI